MTFHMTGQGYAKMQIARGCESTEGLVRQDPSHRTLVRNSFDRGDYTQDPTSNDKRKNDADLRN